MFYFDLQHNVKKDSSSKNTFHYLTRTAHFKNDAKHINCYVIKRNNFQIIIPHFAIAIYYYFRFTEMREAVLDGNLGNLYEFCFPDRNDAKIVLNTLVLQL